MYPIILRLLYYIQPFICTFNNSNSNNNNDNNNYKENNNENENDNDNETIKILRNDQVQ